MRRAFPHRAGPTLALALLVAPTACGDPCRELSDVICRCAPDPVERRRCEQKVSVRAGQYVAPANGPSDADGQRICQARLETCTCEKLLAGDLAACGLTPDAPP